MKFDVVLAGVGGQGILSAAAILAGSALRRDWTLKQSEVHGMAQRGGAVVAHLRMSDGDVHSDLIPRRSADLLVAFEPMEALRWLEYLSPEGRIVSSTNPVENVADYPNHQEIIDDLEATGRAVLVDADALAREAGNIRTANIVVIGAASTSLPMDLEALEAEIVDTFARHGKKVVEANLAGFRLGAAAAAAV